MTQKQKQCMFSYTTDLSESKTTGKKPQKRRTKRKPKAHTRKQDQKNQSKPKTQLLISPLSSLSVVKKVDCSCLWWTSSSLFSQLKMLTLRWFFAPPEATAGTCKARLGGVNSQSLVFSFRILSLCCRVFPFFGYLHTQNP